MWNVSLPECNCLVGKDQGVPFVSEHVTWRMNKTVSDRLCDSEGHGTKLLVDEVIFLHLELFNDGWGALETGESPTPESV